MTRCQPVHKAVDTEDDATNSTVTARRAVLMCATTSSHSSSSEISKCTHHKGEGRRLDTSKKNDFTKRKKDKSTKNKKIEKEKKSGSDEESQTSKKQNSKSFYELLNTEASPTSVKSIFTGSDAASYASACSRLSASSAANRGEMKNIIRSIQQHKACIDDRQHSYKQLEEASARFEDERKAILLKWQTMSDKRKQSTLQTMTRSRVSRTSARQQSL